MSQRAQTAAVSVGATIGIRLIHIPALDSAFSLDFWVVENSKNPL